MSIRVAILFFGLEKSRPRWGRRGGRRKWLVFQQFLSGFSIKRTFFFSISCIPPLVKSAKGGGTSQIIGILRPLIWKRGKREGKRIKKTLACDFWRPRQNWIFCGIRLPSIPTHIWKKNPRSELIEVGRIGESEKIRVCPERETFPPTFVSRPGFNFQYLLSLPTYRGRRERGHKLSLSGGKPGVGGSRDWNWNEEKEGGGGGWAGGKRRAERAKDSTKVIFQFFEFMETASHTFSEFFLCGKFMK